MYEYSEYPLFLKYHDLVCLPCTHPPEQDKARLELFTTASSFRADPAEHNTTRLPLVGGAPRIGDRQLACAGGGECAPRGRSTAEAERVCFVCWRNVPQVWCGRDSAVLYWKSLVLVVGCALRLAPRRCPPGTAPSPSDGSAAWHGRNDLGTTASLVWVTSATTSLSRCRLGAPPECRRTPHAEPAHESSTCHRVQSRRHTRSLPSAHAALIEQSGS